MLKIIEIVSNLISKLRNSANGKCECDYINGAETLPPPLSKEEEAKTLARLNTDFENARETLIVHNLRLVVYIAKKFESTGIGIEDLISIGTIGLIKAVNTFSVEKNIKLATYASRCIENEILMYLRKTNPQKMEVSIDEPLNVDWDGNELLLSDILGTDDDTVSVNIESEAEKRMLLEAVEKLDDSVVEAARDLGASPLHAFFTVTVPLTLSGLMAGCVLVFIPSTGLFFLNDLLGGSKTMLAGNLIQSLMKSRDLPMASALSVLMLAVTGAVIALYRRAGGDADGLGLF